MLIIWWPERFWNAGFYVQKEAVLNLLLLCTGAELAWRCFRAFPGAMARARLIQAATVALTTLAMVKTPSALTLHAIVFGYAPAVSSGAMWLLTMTCLLAAWYRLPIHAIHRAILVGLTLYLGVFTVILEQMRTFDLYTHASPGAIALLGHANAFSYLAMLAGVAFAAWRPAEATVRETSPAVLARLGLDPA